MMTCFIIKDFFTENNLLIFNLWTSTSSCNEYAYFYEISESSIIYIIYKGQLSNI